MQIPQSVCELVATGPLAHLTNIYTDAREFLGTAIAAAAFLTNSSGQTAAALSGLSIVDETGRTDTDSNDLTPGDQDMTDKAEDPRITRARLSGPEQVTKDATVAEMAADGTMTVLVKGTNEWVCTPGNENKIGAPPMCMNPMGMRWMMDAMQGKPKPTNTEPFAGTPYAYLHVCGTPWEGNEYHEGDRAVWTMSYARH
jgi:hypothetical protein